MIGHRVRACRIAMSLSIAEAARRAGVHTVTWSRIENGHSQPDTDTLAKMAAVLRVAVADLLDGGAGEGDAFRVLAEAYRRLSPADQRDVLATVVQRSFGSAMMPAAS